jgi:hypothetical protein
MIDPASYLVALDLIERLTTKIKADDLQNEATQGQTSLFALVISMDVMRRAIPPPSHLHYA